MLETYVQWGMNLLDREYPGWEHKIDLEWLRMHSSKCCVLGQLYGNFGIGVNRLLYPKGLLVFSWSVLHGFGPEDNDWDSLDVLWREAIEGRLGNGKGTISIQ